MGKCKLFKKTSVISSIILIVFISCGCSFNLNLNSNKATNKLYHAIELGNFEAVKEAVSEGCNINSFKPKKVRVWDMAKVDSPLVESLFNNRDDIAEYLIEQGADTNYVSPSGKSILTYLIENYQCGDIFDLLIEKGADVNYVNSEGMSLLEVALDYNYNDAV